MQEREAFFPSGQRAVFKWEYYAVSRAEGGGVYTEIYLYMNLTKPSEYLYLSWSKVSGDGKSLRPAYLISDVRRLFPGLRTVDEEKRTMEETSSPERPDPESGRGSQGPQIRRGQQLERALYMVSAG